MVDKVFKQHIGRNIEVYFDGMVIKSKDDITFLEDMEEILKHMRRTSMKLNPKKCVFRSQKGKFFSHVITTTGI